MSTLRDISNAPNSSYKRQKVTTTPVLVDTRHDTSEAAALEEQLLYMQKRLQKLRHRSSVPPPAVATQRTEEECKETKQQNAPHIPSKPTSFTTTTTTTTATPKTKPTTLELRAQSAHNLLHLDPLDSKFKILVVGNANCGKTSIIQRFVANTFSEKYHTTVGADFHKKNLDWSKVGDKKVAKKVKLHVFDIAGQDRFARLTRSYFNAAKGALVVCDVTREGTFEAAGEWKKELDRALTTYDDQGKPKKVPVVLVANKCDLLRDVQSSFVAGAKMEAACRQHGFAGWFVSSAKSGENIETCMYFLTRQMLSVRDIARAQVQDIFLQAARNTGFGSTGNKKNEKRHAVNNPYDSCPPSGHGIRVKNQLGDVELLYGQSGSGRSKKNGCC